MKQYASDSEWCRVKIFRQVFQIAPSNATDNDVFYLQPLCDTPKNLSAP